VQSCEVQRAIISRGARDAAANPVKKGKGIPEALR